MFFTANATEGSMYIGPQTVQALMFYIEEEMDAAGSKLKVVRYQRFNRCFYQIGIENLFLI